jgi:hypothetical protein
MHLSNWTDHLRGLEAQLNQNRFTAENEIKLKKQQLILEIERLYDSALKDIEIQFKVKSDQIRDKLDIYIDHDREAEQAVDMISLRIKGQSMQKFVKEYMQTMKEGETVLKKKLKIDS